MGRAAPARCRGVAPQRRRDDHRRQRPEEPHIQFVGKAFRAPDGLAAQRSSAARRASCRGRTPTAASSHRIGAAVRRWRAGHAELLNYTWQGRRILDRDRHPCPSPTAAAGSRTRWRSSATSPNGGASSSERRRAELQATLEAVPELLFEIDLEGRYRSFHSPRHDLLYAAPEDFIGRRADEVRCRPRRPEVVMVAAPSRRRRGEARRRPGYELPLRRAGSGSSSR